MSSCAPFVDANATDALLRSAAEDEANLTSLGVILGAFGSIGIAVGELGQARLKKLGAKSESSGGKAKGGSGGVWRSLGRLCTSFGRLCTSRWWAERWSSLKDFFSYNLMFVHNLGVSLVRCSSKEQPHELDYRTWHSVKIANYNMLIVVGAVANFLAFSFASTTILAPLEGLQFVAAFFWTLGTKQDTFWHCSTHGSSNGRRLDWWRTAKAFVGMLCVLAAVTTIVFVVPPPGPKFGIGGLVCLWTRVVWVAFAATLACLAASVYLYTAFKDVCSNPLGSQGTTNESRGLDDGKDGDATEDEEDDDGEDYEEDGDKEDEGGDAEGGRDEGLEGVEGDGRDDRKNKLGKLVQEGFPAAVVGAFAATAAKQISELLRVLFEEGSLDVFHFSAPTHGLLWSTAVMAGAGFFWWMRSLHASAGRLEATLVLPVFQGMYIVLASLTGGVYFDDFVLFTAWQLVAFAFMLLLLLVGVVLMVNEPRRCVERGSRGGGRGTRARAGPSRGRLPAIYIRVGPTEREGEGRWRGLGRA